MKHEPFTITVSGFPVWATIIIAMVASIFYTTMVMDMFSFGIRFKFKNRNKFIYIFKFCYLGRIARSYLDRRISDVGHTSRHGHYSCHGKQVTV